MFSRCVIRDGAVLVLVGGVAAEPVGEPSSTIAPVRCWTDGGVIEGVGTGGAVETRVARVRGTLVDVNRADRRLRMPAAVQHLVVSVPVQTSTHKAVHQQRSVRVGVAADRAVLARA